MSLSKAPISNDSAFPTLPLRERSSSNVSAKRSRIDSSDEDSVMDINVLGSSVDKNGFKLPKKQQRKFKRQDRQKDSQNIQSYAHSLKNGTARANTAKKQFTWGKSEGTSSSGLRGVVPDVFVSRLDVSTTPEMLKEHFITEGIEVSKVEQKSNNEAHFKSFKVSVKSAEDFDKLLSGDHIPKYTQVRKWIYYRKNDKPTSRGNKPKKLQIIVGCSSLLQMTT